MPLPLQQTFESISAVTDPLSCSALTYAMTERSIENHYVSLLLPAFREHADKVLFRPYTGRDDFWESVTYREVEQRLAAAQAHWKRVLAPLNLKPLDIIGFW